MLLDSCKDHSLLSNIENQPKHDKTDMSNSYDLEFVGLKLIHLRLIAALKQSGQLGLAAAHLGLAQPAATRLLGEIERVIGFQVRERLGRGLRLTEAGEALARRAERVLHELRDAAREISELGDGARGHVRIGSVTGPALTHVLPAIRQLRRDQSRISVEVVVSSSDDLCRQLIDGRLDIIIGRVNDPRLQALLDFQPIGVEPLALLARNKHPLKDMPAPKLADALAYDWILPENDKLLTRTVLGHLTKLGFPEPRRQVSTSSFLFTLAVLKETDAIAPLALSVAQSFSDEGVTPLEVGFTLSVESYGLIHRRGSALTPSAKRVTELVNAAALENPLVTK